MAKDHQQSQLIIDLWVKELNHAREELFEAVKETRQTDKILGIAISIVSIVTAAIGLLNKAFSTDIAEIGILSVVSIGLLFLASLFASYLIIFAWDGAFNMSQQAGRVLALETKIYKDLGEPVFSWESSGSMKLNTTAGFYFKGVLNPNVMRASLAALIYLVLQLFILFVLYQVDTTHIWFLILMILTIVFSVLILVFWFRTMHPSFRKNVAQLVYDSLFDSEIMDSIVSSSKEQDSQILDGSYFGLIKANIKLFLLTAIGTICIGFLPVFILSCIQGDILPNGRIELPYLAYTSVYIGDLLFLPVFNGTFFILLKKALTSQSKPKVSRKRILIVSTVSFLFSVAASVTIHYIWASDSIAGFMDTAEHTLTSAGISHLIYTAIQLAIILLYFVLRPRLSSNQELKVFSKIESLIIFVFTLLSLVDFLIRNMIILDRPIPQAFIEGDWQNLIIILGVGLGIIATNIWKGLSKKRYFE